MHRLARLCYYCVRTFAFPFVIITGITAAVVGVILSLALFSAQHVFFLDASSNRLDVTVGLAILSLWLQVQKTEYYQAGGAMCRVWTGALLPVAGLISR